MCCMYGSPLLTEYCFFLYFGKMGILFYYGELFGFVIDFFEVVAAEGRKILFSLSFNFWSSFMFHTIWVAVNNVL